MSIEPGKTSGYQALPTPLPVTIKPIQEWRRTYFGSQENTGDGADTNDYDHDGIPNLLEYAFDTDPLLANAYPMTAVLAPHPYPTSANVPTAEFWCNALHSDINYILEQSTNLSTWTKLGTSTGGQPFAGSSVITDPYYPYPDRDPHRKVTAYSGATKVFFRVRIETTP